MKIIISKLLEMDLTGKSVAIIGVPNSGKSWIYEKLTEKLNFTHRFFATDDYIEFGFKESIYALLDDITTTNSPTIVEGVGCYRLLRKGIETDRYKPDIVIIMNTSDKNIESEYLHDEKKLKSVKSMIKGNKTVFDKYLSMLNDEISPIFYEIDNNYEIKEC